MDVIKPARIREYAKTHARAKASLEEWLTKVRRAQWKRFADVRSTVRSVDQTRVASGRTVLIFNIGGNAFRLICAAHFNRNHLYVLRFLTHAEYSKDQWKKEL